jgi:hypothetical protein
MTRPGSTGLPNWPFYLAAAVFALCTGPRALIWWAENRIHQNAGPE